MNCTFTYMLHCLMKTVVAIYKSINLSPVSIRKSLHCYLNEANFAGGLALSANLFISFFFLLGSFRDHDGTSITKSIKKYNWNFTYESLDTLKSFTLFIKENSNFLDCVLKTLILNYSTCQVVLGQFVIGQFNKPITFKVVV